ncbi:LacI family DNA-binding transcriptional regulator [Cutibacterium equinum]|uniref:LacI family DNA-binding transcriptional regulator n=1 Tax=Cutibacterium equinum TaxID=3016342 RepID=A0ABY7QY38_9ACTN|nr:LacI family DNA-binding transcriptional regulator [Cutibacterium equinum]WCC79308.1 LacI family DNA-binding transcriptional regulator [Cutibacterium equinum]
MNRPTLAEIADQAGVSQATVSRVLNDKAGVSDSTRQCVLTALDVLGYQRPTHLKPVTTGLVGLIVPELTNPVFASHAQAIETLLSKEGYATAVCTQAPGGMREDDYIRVLRSRQVSGIIVICGSHADTTADMSTYQELVDIGLPLVLVNGYAPSVATPQISDDDTSAMDQAVAHLVDLGHTHIGLAVGPRRYVTVQRKEQSLRAAMDRRLAGHGRVAVSNTVFSVDGGARAAVDLLDHGVSAIICGSDLMALGAIRAVRAQGLSVPRDISVIGSDDSALMRYTDPPLTSLHQDVGLISTMAVQSLIGLVRGDAACIGERLVRPELVIRATTGPVRTTSAA